MKKLCLWVILQILVLTLSTLAFNIHSANSAEITWWNSAWMCRRQINITEKSGYSLVNFPVEVVFEHDGMIQPDGRDIRIIEDNVEIPFCITGTNSSWATVMFLANLTSLSSKSICVYYGNADADEPSYPLVSLTINEGQQKGNATIDNRVFIGWDYVSWGVQPGWYFVGGNLVYIDNPPVVLWENFRMDFDENGMFDNYEDLLTDLNLWKGGIGRCHMQEAAYVERSFGLGNYQRYTRTPIYVEIVFDNVTLRVYKSYNFVETTQADRLQIYGSLWNYAKHKDGAEENIIDGVNANIDLWNILYNSSISPGWIAYRNSLDCRVLGAIGFNVSSSYAYYFPAKESQVWDRLVFFDYTSEQILSPLDQPSDCRIYWYADGSDGYSEIDRTANILSNPPSFSVLSEEIIPEFPPVLILAIIIVTTTTAMVIGKSKSGQRRKT